LGFEWDDYLVDGLSFVQGLLAAGCKLQADLALMRISGKDLDLTSMEYD
jgi:hypothetical protein